MVGAPPKVPMSNTDLRWGLLHNVLGFVFLLGSILPPTAGGNSYSGWFVLMWPTSNLIILGLAYVFDGSCGVRMLGKSKTTGNVSVVSTLFFFPYLLGLFVFWRIKHLYKGESVCDEVAEGVWVGRYPLCVDVGDKRFAQRPLTHAVDLTAEFPSRPAFHGKLTYLCAPSLDFLLADPKELLSCAQVIVQSYRENSKSTVYIHCANGHGRSGLFAAIVLVMRGDCLCLDEARNMMKLRRSVLHWQRHQEKVAERVLELWKDQAEVELTGV